MNYSRVNLELFQRRIQIKDLLVRLGLKAGVTYMTLGGHRHNREVQEKVARFLGIDGRELFGSNWWEEWEKRRDAS